MAVLSVNIDHVATVRQARRTYEPDPAWAAVECQLGGAAGITVHLREDRRHIQDHDVERVTGLCQPGVKFNLEMAATKEMVGIALRVKPRMAMFVPEGRAEVTTEGGLDVAGQAKRLSEAVKRLRGAGIGVSAFIDAEERQVDAAAKAGFSVCEIHTGPYAHRFDEVAGDFGDPHLAKLLNQVATMGKRIADAGMQFNAGHALNYRNVTAVASLPDVGELHIGHAIVSRAIFVGMREATREMVQLITRASGHE